MLRGVEKWSVMGLGLILRGFLEVFVIVIVYMGEALKRGNLSELEGFGIGVCFWKLDPYLFGKEFPGLYTYNEYEWFTISG